MGQWETTPLPNALPPLHTATLTTAVTPTHHPVSHHTTNHSPPPHTPPPCVTQHHSPLTTHSPPPSPFPPPQCCWAVFDYTTYHNPLTPPPSHPRSAASGPRGRRPADSGRASPVHVRGQHGRGVPGEAAGSEAPPAHAWVRGRQGRQVFVDDAGVAEAHGRCQRATGHG